MKDRTIEVKGPKGTLARELPPNVNVTVDGGQIAVVAAIDGRDGARFQGLARALLAGMVTGVAAGYTKTLQLVGTGYRAELKGQALNLRLGFSHPIALPAAEGDQVRDPGRLEGHPPHPHGRRQGGDGPDRGQDPRLPAAGALRRQGRSLPRREGPREGGQGREGRQESRRHGDAESSGGSAGSCASARRSAGPPSGRASACSAARSTSTRRSSTTRAARPSRTPRRCRRTCAPDSSEATKIDAAKKVGQAIAKLLLEKGIQSIVFDRNGYLYHGRVRALADAARAAGLKF